MGEEDKPKKRKFGGPQPGSGRPKGGKNESTKQWEALGRYFLEEGAEKALKILQESPKKDFLRFYQMFLDYFKPRYKSIEQKVEQSSEITIIREVIIKPNDDGDNNNEHMESGSDDSADTSDSALPA